MTKICSLLIILALYFILYTLYPYQPARALEPTPVSTQSADLKSKLKSLQDQIASRAAEFKAEITKKLQNKAYVGLLKSKSDLLLTISINGSDKTVKVNEYTQYSGKTKLTLKSLQVGDTLAALGDVDEAEVLTARKIIRLDTLLPEKKVILGNVVSISGNTLNIQTKDNQNLTFTINKDTSYQAGKDEVDLSDIKLNNTVVVVSLVSKNSLTGRFVYLIPGSSLNLKPKTSSSSAQPSTPSATIKLPKTSN